jgi:LacI family transcriptional regulator
MAITIKDIAEAGGFSVTAVSRALSNKDGVSEETRQKIREIADRLGYLPNSAARSLRTKSTKTLGVIIQDITKPYFGKMVKGIDDTAVAHGYNILMCNTNLNPVQEVRAVEILLERSVDGVVFHPTQLTEEGIALLQKSGIPFVTIGRRFLGIKTNYVVTNNREGIKTILNYLVSKGSRNILFFNSPTFTSTSHDRMEGYKEALRDNGLEYREHLVKIIQPNFQSGYLAMGQALSQGLTFDSVLCGRDMIAVGVLEALLEHGFKIPQDVRLTGYDDLDFTAHLKVPLTTIRQPIYEIGMKAVEILIERIESKSNDIPFAEVILTPQLVVRDSA